MRLSVEENDEGFKNFVFMLDQKCRATVYVDNVLQEDVITADEEKGFVYKADSPLRVHKDHVVMKYLQGKVVISITKENSNDN